jgi:hypothetical protein
MLDPRRLDRDQTATADSERMSASRKRRQGEMAGGRIPVTGS